MTLPVTALTAAICALMLLITAIATVRQRFVSQAAFGDAGSPALIAAMRSHGNLAEHAPLFVIMIALLELANVHHWALTGLAVMFLSARAVHIVGLHGKHLPGKPPAARSIGVMGTWLAYVLAILWIFYLVITVNG